MSSQTSVRAPYLTKSKYMNGRQCLKLLWYAANDTSVFPPLGASTRALFDQGNEINIHARQVFPGGILIPQNAGFSAALTATRKAVEKRVPVFEASVSHDQLFARVDVLRPGETGWHLIEVKSSTQVKDEHLEEVAFQKLLCDRAGIPIEKCFVMHVDNTYVRRGGVEPSKLLALQEVTRPVGKLIGKVDGYIEEMRSRMQAPRAPDVPIGGHCNAPYACPLKSMCWAGMPEHHVFTLKIGGSLSEELFKAGILDIKDIPDGIELTPHQAIQVACRRSETPHVDPGSLKTFLDEWIDPLYLLDFETLSPAVPAYDLSSPYEQVPFQYSLKRVSRKRREDSSWEYLHEGCADPRPEVLRRLKREIGPEGTIIAYNSKFEIKVLRSAAVAYPEYGDWVESLVPRFSDLYQPFRNFHYYNPSQLGSASLKVVMPALTGKSYSSLEIGAGDLASREFCRITFGDADDTDCRKVRDALIRYCRQDTEGLVEVINEMERLSGSTRKIL
ncbi:DUF2779 domain-containing protein [bacterium]|nr:DUF2779 domain-containing protein [bacterium]